MKIFSFIAKYPLTLPGKRIRGDTDMIGVRRGGGHFIMMCFVYRELGTDGARDSYFWRVYSKVDTIFTASLRTKSLCDPAQ